MKKNEYRLAVGDLVLGMSFHPTRYAARFREYFDCECSQEIPDIHLDFKISRRKTATGIENSLFTSKALMEKGFDPIFGYQNRQFVAKAEIHPHRENCFNGRVSLDSMERPSLADGIAGAWQRSDF